MCKPGGIVFGSENSYVVVWSAECFHALIGLLSIVQSWCHAMETEVWISNEGWGRPLASFDAVVRFDMAIYCISSVTVVG